MESLIGYGSEDDLDEPTYRKRPIFRQADVNYEEVQMDLSEDSSNSPKSNVYQPTSKSSYASKQEDKYRRGSDDYKSKYDKEKHSPKYEKSRSEYKSRDKYRNEDNKGERYRDDKSKDYKSDRSRDDKDKRRDDRSRDYRSRDTRDSVDKYKESKSYDSRESNRDSKYSREKDRDRYDSRDSSSRSSRSYESRDGRTYDSRDSSRNDSKSRRLSSPSRHRSRSPVRTENRSRRSSSRDNSHSGYSSKYDRNATKMDRLEKLGIDYGASSERAGPSSQASVSESYTEKNRFYMPGITGRFTEQIQRRKLLWQKKDAKEAEVPVQKSPAVLPPTGKVWQNTTFAQDTDGKVANKFKRLMGIKGAVNEPAKPATEILKKQEEMFSSMEAQYEVARTATHTMRGVGLGFGSFQR